MAESKQNVVMRNTSGAIGKQVVFKMINGKTFAGKYPDMSQVKYNKEQLEYRKLFSEAVKYAREVMNNPAQKAAYAKQILQGDNKRLSVYHAALKGFMAAHSHRIPHSVVETSLQKYVLSCTLSDRQVKAVKHLIQGGRLTNATYQQLNKVSKATATRDLQSLVQKQVIIPLKAQGAGAVYTLLIREEEEE